MGADLEIVSQLYWCGIEKCSHRSWVSLLRPFIHGWSLTNVRRMFAIRARRKVATEKDFLAAVDKVIKGNLKFSSTSTYMQYN